MVSRSRRLQRRPGFGLRKRVLPWLFILPIMLVHGVAVIGPSLSSLYYSLTDWGGFGQADFIGLGNFRRLLLEDKRFVVDFGHNLMWMSFFLTVPYVMSLTAAVLLAQIRRGAMALRTIIFVPYVLPSVVTAYVWQGMLSPWRGVGAQLARWGLPGLNHSWLGDPATALWAVAFANNWQWWGFPMLLFLTAMQNISPDLYDAAGVDGANRWQEFRHVTIPGILPTVVFMLMMSAVGSLLGFQYVWLMTEGGPAGASELMGVYTYRMAFEHFEFGYATATGLVTSCVGGIIIGLFALLRRLGWEV